MLSLTAASLLPWWAASLQPKQPQEDRCMRARGGLVILIGIVANEPPHMTNRMGLIEINKSIPLPSYSHLSPVRRIAALCCEVEARGAGGGSCLSLRDGEREAAEARRRRLHLIWPPGRPARLHPRPTAVLHRPRRVPRHVPAVFGAVTPRMRPPPYGPEPSHTVASHSWAIRQPP